MSDSNEKSVAFTWLWLIVMVMLYFIISISLVSSTLMNDLMVKEVEMYYEVFGEESTNGIIEDAHDKRVWLIRDSGAYDGVRTLLLPKDFIADGEVHDSNVFTTKFFSAVDEFIEKAFHSLDLAILRFCALKPWAALGLITLGLGVYTGYYKREIKKHNFDYSSPFRRGISKKTLIMTPVIFIIIFVIPFPITPLYAPALSILIGTAFLLFISNTIKRL